MPTTSPSAESPSKKRFIRVFGAIAYGLLCLVSLSVGISAGWVKKSPLAWKVVVGGIGERVGIKQPAPADIFQKDEMTVLLLGCDQDYTVGGKRVTKEKARSDMILLAKFDFARNRVGAISIPRDLYCKLPGYGGHKINAFHAIGGPELAQQAVSEKLGVDIDRTLVLNFEAFQEMVDLVGGIDVYVPKTMKYTDRAGGLFIDLTQGRHKLDGYNAMCFVRFRHSDTDFARAERQRDFMIAFKSSIMQNPAQLPGVVEKAYEALGGGFSRDELATLSLFLRKVKSDNIKMGAVPVNSRGRSDYTLELDQNKLQETLQQYYLKPGGYSSAASTSGSGVNL